VKRSVPKELLLKIWGFIQETLRFLPKFTSGESNFLTRFTAAEEIFWDCFEEIYPPAEVTSSPFS
jgi:hypothetical protein